MRTADYPDGPERGVVYRELKAAVFTAPGTKAVRCLGQVRVRFSYDADDPFAVKLAFADTLLVVWTISRELLAAGLRGPAGDGDVKITPGDPKVRLVLSSPNGRCALFFHRTDLIEALAATAALVPYGSEADRIDWDREIARLGEVA